MTAITITALVVIAFLAACLVSAIALISHFDAEYIGTDDDIHPL